MLQQYQPIKAWSEDDQPREKLIYKGKHTLSDAEVLAIILGSGTRRKSAVDLAREIMDTVKNDWSKLARMNVKELMQFSGVGEAKAISVIAALEIGRRRKDNQTRDVKKISNSSDAYEYLKQHFMDLQHEEFRIIMLNRNNVILGEQLIGKGGLSSTIADGKLIFKTALQHTASSVILCHNHPSGNLKASDSDIKLTKDLSAFGALIDLHVIDHIIFTDNGYLSFSDRGLL